MNTQVKTIFRAATVADCPTAARLMQIAADGVCDYIWSLQQPEFPTLTPLEIGARCYAEGEGNFSYRHCTMAVSRNTRDEERTQGMMMAFAIPPTSPSTTSLENKSELASLATDVLAPYAMEQPNSWYICALAVFPEHRGQGIGTQLLSLATTQARSRGLPLLSLLCFEQNVGALSLYQRHGFQVVDRAAVIPHPLIHHTGNVLLMTQHV
ncbi:MAG: GNAT family N-acetyltransferase [Cyanobacteria bacterium J06638_28]